MLERNGIRVLSGTARGDTELIFEVPTTDEHLVKSLVHAHYGWLPHEQGVLRVEGGCTHIRINGWKPREEN